MMRRVLVAAALAGIAFARVADAVDAPHDGSVRADPVSCRSCHVAHGADGASLTTTAGNANSCASCHVGSSTPEGRFGFPWAESLQAVPGAGGVHHSWDAEAVSADAGALAPRKTPPPHLAGKGYDAMAYRLSGTKIQCSTCHDQHAAFSFNADESPRARGRQHTSLEIGVASPPNAGGSGGTLAIAAVASDASPKGYLVEVLADGRYKLSNDRGGSWFGCATGTYTYQAFNGANGCVRGTGVALNDGNKMTVTFGGSPAAGARWVFYVSYPFLRAEQLNDGMCVECHRERDQLSIQVIGSDPSYLPDGVRTFSHPVGEEFAPSVLLQPAIRDANGVAQATGDGNATNDLLLHADPADGNKLKIRCTTCHSPHNADSNGLTVDRR
jgi:predicted CXXCH cytochrome family protein